MQRGKGFKIVNKSKELFLKIKCSLIMRKNVFVKQEICILFTYLLYLQTTVHISTKQLSALTIVLYLPVDVLNKIISQTSCMIVSVL